MLIAFTFCYIQVCLALFVLDGGFAQHFSLFFLGTNVYILIQGFKVVVFQHQHVTSDTSF